MTHTPQQIQHTLSQLQAHIHPTGAQLIAVSKHQPLPALHAAYQAGQRHFGESRLQELQQKHPHMPPDTRWHFIGHLQTNKVKALLPLIHLIHTIDSPRLMQARLSLLNINPTVSTSFKPSYFPYYFIIGEKLKKSL